MQKGFNSDIQYQGKTYHIQTEDWGLGNPFIVTRIFCNGAVLKTIKTPYSSFLNAHQSFPQDERIRLALRNQHSEILESLARARSSTIPT